MTKGMSVTSAKEQHDRASDFVVKQKEQEKQQRQERKTQPKSTGRDKPTPPPTAPNSALKESFSASSNKIQKIPFLVEEMKYIFQFKATLRPIPIYQQTTTDDHFELSIQCTGDSSSALKFQQKQETLFGATFPRRLIPDQCSWQSDDKDGTIHLRLQFEEPLYDHELAPLETQHYPAVINQLQCRYCQQPLLKDKPIEQAHLLPKGNWDEIADYLICYSGQPIVDFSSSSVARRSVAMQDSNALCLHHLDLGTSVCVLAVAGYGEAEDNHKSEMDLLKEGAATARGNRSWQDASGGATICCSQCCSPLGFASIESPETYRLLKHRLLVGSTNHELSSCASFLAREMVRYAESKAIFTFIIGVNDGGSMHAPTTTKCLLLRLVSWDTNIATEVLHSERLDFRKVAKIVFEEMLDKFNETDDVTKWVWGGVDLCCLPLGGEQDNQSSEDRIGKVSTVRLQLPPDEYDQVLSDLLKNSNQFSKCITDATIMMKMGMDASRNNLGLTAISLE
jgi:hypothetical protein